jgi:transcriptional regulator with XRE-family HTH domain
MARPTLGDVVRRQRELQELSLRQMAQLAGISNPYLSQIERGLREPSAKVVDALAGALDTSTDALYEAAGIRRSEEAAGDSAVSAAIAADPDLKPPQRRALIELYDACVAANVGPRRRPR